MAKMVKFETPGLQHSVGLNWRQAAWPGVLAGQLSNAPRPSIHFMSRLFHAGLGGQWKSTNADTFPCVDVMFPFASLLTFNYVAFAGSCWRMLFFQVQNKKSKKCGGKNLIKCCSGLVWWVLRGAGILTMLARPHVSTLDLRPDRKSCIGL